LAIVNPPQGPQKHKTNTRRTIIRRKIQKTLQNNIKNNNQYMYMMKMAHTV